MRIAHDPWILVTSFRLPPYLYATIATYKIATNTLQTNQSSA